MALEPICSPESIHIIEERLELMRSLEGHPLEECHRLAEENIHTFIPMVAEMGVFSLQNELQELTIRFGYPDEYQQIKEAMKDAEDSFEQVFDAFRKPICALLDSLEIDYDFVYRMKSAYGIWRKFKTDGKSFAEIYDIYAARIIYRPKDSEKSLQELGIAHYNLNPQPLSVNIFDPEILECWRIYTAITSLYRVQPDRIKDWVTTPKPSGYQALHMTCLGPEGNWIEVQIRSERMHEEAEHGKAAHWKYKKETHSIVRDKSVKG